MKSKILAPLLIAGLVGLGLGACGDDNEAQVNVVVQKAGQADNVVAVVLWAHPSGTSYDFDVVGTAMTTKADFTLDVTYVGDMSPTQTVDFSLPLADVDAEEGETGSGSQTCDIYPGDNWCYIPFAWTSNPPPSGDTNITLQFSHPPKIVAWSAVPGPGVPAGTALDIKAAVEFYGSSGQTVTAQFFDTDPATPVGMGTAGTLTDPDADGIWTGTVTTVAGAELLRLTATDDDGTTTSDASYLVAP